MNANNEKETSEKRRRTRSNLITLTVCVALSLLLLVSLIIGSIFIKQAKQRHGAAGFLREVLGAEVIYGTEERPGFFKWLREISGGDYYATVTEIRFDNPKIKDSILNPDTRVIETLRQLPDLQRIDLHGSQITSKGQENLQRALPHISITR